MNNHKLDHVLFGLLIAFIVAALGAIMLSGVAQFFAQSGAIDETTSSISTRRDRTTYLVAICLNIITINYLKRISWLEAQRGVVVGTFICAVIWIVIYKDYLF